MKHKFFGIIICTAAALILSSCGKSENKISEDGRKILVLARSEENNYSRETIDKLIGDFNGSNGEYYIQEQVYQSCDNLFTDIAAGKQPDLIYIGDWVDISALYNQEMLCDLYTLIDSDSDISRDIYVESVLKAMETNGSLYRMPYDFTVESALAKEELWGADKDTSVENIIKKAEELGCDIPFDFTADSYSFLSYITSEYVDLSNGSCCFDDGRFEEFITFMKQYYNVIKNCSDEELYEKFKRNELLVMSSGFAGFDQIDYIEHDVSDRVKYIGFPSNSENYHIAVPQISFSIFSASEDRLGAFEFIKYCTSYEAYIEKVDGFDVISSKICFPVNKEALEFCYNRSIELNLYDLDEDLKREHNDEIMAQINSVNGAGTQEGAVIGKVISEELSSYFDGNKSAGEVCSLIQNRLSIYFEEQRR